MIESKAPSIIALSHEEPVDAPGPQAGESLRGEAFGQHPQGTVHRLSYVYQFDSLEHELRSLVSSGDLLAPEIGAFLEENVRFTVVPRGDLPNPNALLVANPDSTPMEILINGDLLEQEASFIKMYDLTERQRHFLLALALLPSIAQDGAELYEIDLIQRSMGERMDEPRVQLVPMCEEFEFLGLLAHAETAMAISGNVAGISDDTGISEEMLRRVFQSPGLGVLSRELLPRGGAGGASAYSQNSSSHPEQQTADTAFSVLTQMYTNEFSMLQTGGWSDVAREVRATREDLERLTVAGGATNTGPSELAVWAQMSGISPIGLRRLSESLERQELALLNPEPVQSTIRALMTQRLQERGVLRYFQPTQPPNPAELRLRPNAEL